MISRWKKVRKADEKEDKRIAGYHWCTHDDKDPIQEIKDGEVEATANFSPEIAPTVIEETAPDGMAVDSAAKRENETAAGGTTQQWIFERRFPRSGRLHPRQRVEPGTVAGGP